MPVFVVVVVGRFVVVDVVVVGRLGIGRVVGVVVLDDVGLVAGLLAGLLVGRAVLPPPIVPPPVAGSCCANVMFAQTSRDAKAESETRETRDRVGMIFLLRLRRSRVTLMITLSCFASP